MGQNSVGSSIIVNDLWRSLIRQRKREVVVRCLRVYFLLLRARATAATTIIMTTAAMIM
jgi:hypothetical protein